MRIRTQILLVLLLQGLSGYSQNLIPNPDFEEGPDSSAYGWENRLEGCTVTGSMDGPNKWYKVIGSPDRLVNGDITCDFSQVDAQSGAAYVDFVYGESGKTILLQALQKGETYKLTYWARWQTFQGAAIVPSGIKFIFYGANILEPKPVKHKDKWKYFEITFVATANSREMEIMGTIDKFGGVCVDNLSLEKQGSETATDSLVPIPRADLKRYLDNN